MGQFERFYFGGEYNRGADPRARWMGANLPADIQRAQSGQVPCSATLRGRVQRFVGHVLALLSFNLEQEACCPLELTKGVFLAGIPVGNVFHEQENQDIVIVLRRIHAAAQFITAFPE